jgi:AcrR family transcriptional regulator
MYHIKNDKRSIQSGQWIYEALAELMKEKNYEDIKVTEIVEKAKVGRTTFYRNFDTIDDVLRMKCDETFDNLYKYIVDYYNENDFSSKTLFMKPLLRFWYLNSDIMELLLKANKLDIINYSAIKIVDAFEPLISPKSIAIKDHWDYFISLQSGIFISILSQWIKNGKDIPPDDLADLIYRQIFESFNMDLLPKNKIL